jgi:lysophospholipase L1-like esterase
MAATIHNKAAVQGFLDKVESGYFTTHRGHLIMTGDSIMNGACAYNPDVDGLDVLVRERFKAASGRDGGRMVHTGQYRTVWDYRKTEGRDARQKGLRDIYWLSEQQGEAKPNWQVPVYAVSTTVADGGFLGFYSRSNTEAPAWSASAYSYTNIKENGQNWVLTNLHNATSGAASPLPAWPALTAVAANAICYGTDNNFYICTVAGTTGAGEPTWNANPTVTVDGTATWLQLAAAAAPPSFVRDNTCYWICEGEYDAGTPPAYTPFAWPPPDWAANKVYDYYPQQTSTAPYTWNVVKLAAAGKTWQLRLVGGKSTTVKPTFNVYEVIDGSIVWRGQGPSGHTVLLPPAVRYALVHGTDTDNGVLSVNSDQPLTDLPATVNMSGASTLWGNKTLLPGYTRMGSRSLSFTKTGGTPAASCKVEGILCLKTLDDTGLISYTLGVNGREAYQCYTALNGNVARQRAFVGSNFIPNNEPVCVVIALGVNDYGHGISQANAILGVTNLVDWFQAYYTDCSVVFVTYPPTSAAGSPVAGDAQYDYFQALGNAAVAAGAAWIDCSQSHFGLSAAGAAAAGYLEAGSLGHPSSTGHSLIANDIIDALELPAEAPPTGVITDADIAAIVAGINDDTALGTNIASMGPKVTDIWERTFSNLSSPARGNGTETLTRSDGTTNTWEVDDDGYLRTKTRLT